MIATATDDGRLERLRARLADHPATGWLVFALATAVAAGSSYLAPQDADRFWIGELGAPYLVLPLLAAAARRTIAGAIAIGTATSAAMVAGYYRFWDVGDVSLSSMDLPVTTTVRDAMLDAYGRWFSAQLLGTGGRPWLAIAVVTGAVAGVLAHRWHTRGGRAVPIIVAIVLLVEPVVHASGLAAVAAGTDRYPWDGVNLGFWVAELLLGLVVVVLLVRDREADPSHSPGLQGQDGHRR